MLILAFLGIWANYPAGRSPAVAGAAGHRKPGIRPFRNSGLESAWFLLHARPPLAGSSRGVWWFCNGPSVRGRVWFYRCWRLAAKASTGAHGHGLSLDAARRWRCCLKRNQPMCPLASPQSAVPRHAHRTQARSPSRRRPSTHHPPPLRAVPVNGNAQQRALTGMPLNNQHEPSSIITPRTSVMHINRHRNQQGAFF